MAVLIFMAVALIYITILVFISYGVYGLTKLKSLAVMVFLLLAVAPVHEGLFGYPEFKRFDREHPGVECSAEVMSEGILVEGRRAYTPREARHADDLAGRFQFKELPRDMVASMQPRPSEPLRAYVQFFLTNQDDASCTQRIESPSGLPNCIGVTSSDTPKSQYSVLQEPDRRQKDVDLQLNDSKLFPIFGSHVRIRDVRTNKTIAERWSFSLPSKLVPWFPWYSALNPSHGIEPTLCVVPATESPS